MVPGENGRSRYGYVRQYQAYQEWIIPIDLFCHTKENKNKKKEMSGGSVDIVQRNAIVWLHFWWSMSFFFYSFSFFI